MGDAAHVEADNARDDDQETHQLEGVDIAPGQLLSGNYSPSQSTRLSKWVAAIALHHPAFVS